MRHAVLGAGRVGGLIAGALAQSGALGDFEVDCPATSMLDREVDVLWITTKATQLELASNTVLLARPQTRV